MNQLNEPLLQKTALQGNLEAINYQRRAFQSWKTTSLSSYLEYKKSPFIEDCLLILNGVDPCFKGLKESSYRLLLSHLLQDEATIQRRSGGYWMRLQDQGIAINPGLHFLERLHDQGLHIWEIDHIFVTDGTPSASKDLERIYTLNNEINSLLRQWNLPPHIIRYFLHKEAYSQFAPLLQPHCREERECLQMLATFAPPSAFEQISLQENLSVDFAPTSLNASSLMLQFSSKNQPILGFTTEIHSSKQNALMTGCKNIIIGAGKIDLQSLSPENLAGSIKAIASPLTLISEIDFSEGDNRIEGLAALREELSSQNNTILPCDVGLKINLESQSLTGPGLLHPTDVHQVKTTRSQGAFSPLQYIELSSLL